MSDLDDEELEATRRLNGVDKESDNEDKILMFSNRYQVNKNLDVYLSAAKVDFRGQNREVSQNNKGYAVVSGLSLNF